MQNQFALKTDHHTDSDIESYPVSPPYSHTAHIGNYRVNKVSGEIYGEYIVSQFAPEPMPVQEHSGIPRATYTPSQHLDLTNVNNSNVVYVDFGGSASVQSTTPAETSCTTPRRGPRPKIRLNPHAAIIKAAVAERTHWIEHAVMAGMYIAVESSNGRLNIKPGYVRKVITMPVVSSDTIARNTAFRNHDMEPVSDRYVRYLAAAGRVALGCIERHLHQHPGEQQRLEKKVLAAGAWGEGFDLVEGDYFEDQQGKPL